jgi:hypothetical protein
LVDESEGLKIYDVDYVDAGMASGHLGLSDATKASLAKADTALQPGDLPTVNNGKFTVKGDGTYVTGTGSMTADQAGDTEVTLTLSDDVQEIIDNAPIVVMPEDETTYDGSFAMFNRDNNLVSGGTWAPGAWCNDGDENGGGDIAVEVSGCECLGDDNYLWFGFGLSGSDTIRITNSDADN